ncbi:hypothetical protein TNCV_1441901 [Trichonephila clavipes]|uniref:Uncharacterized protein n=1 Tax=Trichonephila clavipes TaxID=2585209 RepID=A0A8X6RS25_TRICX|nr:hypothetical protein TNCV_1441901 [Trichonephila clavipes]
MLIICLLGDRTQPKDSKTRHTCPVSALGSLELESSLPVRHISAGKSVLERRVTAFLITIDSPRSSGRVVAYRASTPQVRVLFPGWARSTQPFIPSAVGR